MMKGKKILFLSTQLPYPPHSGGLVKSWNFVKHLSKNNQLSIACLLKDDDAKYLEGFQNKCSLHALEAFKSDIPRNAITLLKSYFSAPCLNAYRNQSNDLQSAVNKLVIENDYLIVDHYEMFQFVPQDCKAKIILHTHNAEFMLWKRMGELSSNPLKKLLLKIETYRVKQYEKRIFSQADLVFATPSDIDLYKLAGFDTSNLKTTYHLGNDQLLNLPNIEFETTEKCITFMGTLSWEPNIDGLLWFIEKVFPIILRKNPDCNLYILGKDPDQRLVSIAKNKANIVFTGFIKDLDSYLQKTRVYIAPLRFGSGMKVKVLEGLYRGVPSVLTSVAAEGLLLENDKHAFISDEPTIFAKYCEALIRDQKTWEKFRDNSRVLANKEYKWSMLFEKMDQDFLAL